MEFTARPRMSSDEIHYRTVMSAFVTAGLPFACLRSMMRGIALVAVTSILAFFILSRKRRSPGEDIQVDGCAVSECAADGTPLSLYAG